MKPADCGNVGGTTQRWRALNRSMTITRIGGSHDDVPTRSISPKINAQHIRVAVGLLSLDVSPSCRAAKRTASYHARTLRGGFGLPACRSFKSTGNLGFLDGQSDTDDMDSPIRESRRACGHFSATLVGVIPSDVQGLPQESMGACKTST